MLELINAIPENIGWVIVGFTGCLCCQMILKLGKCLWEMWQERREEDEEEE